MDFSVAYMAQIRSIARRVEDWKAKNPGRNFSILFNYPPKVMLAATISEAIANHFVTADETGLELIREVTDWEKQNEATVFMFRIALENSKEFA